MTKPRIFIHMHYMALGGAERALLGLLNALDPNRVNVDLFLNQHTGEFMPLIPKHVNLLPEHRGYNAIERPMKTILKEGQFGVLYGRLKAKWQHRRYMKNLSETEKCFDSSGDQYVSTSVARFLPSLEVLGEYDLAISFLHPHDIVLQKVKAKKKIAWIHSDYSTIHVNVEKELPVWSAYDNIASISSDCTRSFLKAFPTLENKIVEIENILSPDFVRQQADKERIMGLDPNGITMLSIGRYCYQKNFDNIPDVARRIIQTGHLDLRWYLIGYGGDEQLIRRKIEEAGMQDHVIILGKKNNPYPYIKACDFYVQPSRYEGKSVTVREAQILGKPVVVTAYPTASAQIRNGIDGVIVPMDNEGCALGITRLIANKALQGSIIEYLKTHDYGNESEVEKIYELI